VACGWAGASPAGMLKTALQEGQATRLPAMVSGALSFLPHVHRTKIGTARSHSPSACPSPQRLLIVTSRAAGFNSVERESPIAGRQAS
jgi:hypothetical protein